ncbi:DUF4178 domain-containing protein [Parasulfitobacter algicola]|uniref:DUF4178 domain-containing protein n=1 Tax=Parasulfitobacter algicola TaxID=2614809 RepID=A0ABX2IT11_9RHOB|nr:DUF4178 domain-containing protein [Sulfitobacter algicola]NSX53338.1 DUF4178 domain-containing protein [Sulfitobacter algicola]
MTRASELTAINCTNCGAGLDVLGGGRVVSHVCGYCGSVLDAQHDYKVLKQFTDMPRPTTPFRIGMSGVINGVEFTIIGTLGKREDYRGRTWLWTDHQLFSPTHGYAWLTVENGHFVFTRKMREQPNQSWISSDLVEMSDYPPVAWFKGKSYKYFSTTTGRTVFVEGEFNWLPEVGDQNTAIALMSDDSMLRYVDGKTEREIELSTYLPFEETCTAFGLETENFQRDVHPLQPFTGSGNKAFVRKVFLGFAAISLFASVIFLMLPGTLLLSEPDIPDPSLPRIFEFQIENPDQLTQISIRSNVSNNWAAYTLELTDPKGETVFDTFRQTSYYHGREGGENWTEGSQRANIRFRPTEAGTYKLNLDREDGSVETRISVSVRSNITTSLWTFLAMGFFGIAALFIPNGKTRHNSKRWAKSDWSDD